MCLGKRSQPITVKLSSSETRVKINPGLFSRWLNPLLLLSGGRLRLQLFGRTARMSSCHCCWHKAAHEVICATRWRRDRGGKSSSAPSVHQWDDLQYRFSADACRLPWIIPTAEEPTCLFYFFCCSRYSSCPTLLVAPPQERPSVTDSHPKPVTDAHWYCTCSCSHGKRHLCLMNDDCWHRYVQHVVTWTLC